MMTMLVSREKKSVNLLVSLPKVADMVINNIPRDIKIMFLVRCLNNLSRKWILLFFWFSIPYH